MRIRDFVAWISVDASLPPDARWVEAADRERGTDGTGWRVWGRGALRVAYRARGAVAAGAATTDLALPLLLLGDDAEWDGSRPDANLAGGVPVTFDEHARELIVRTSIVGLPPVYVHRARTGAVMGSDLYLMSRAPGVQFALDPVGVAELARFGHPVEHRTLFGDTALAAAGGTLTLGVDGTTRFVSSWSLPAPAPVERHVFIDAQMAAFTDAVRRTTLDGTFLSLTAGLDTRAIFAELAHEGRLVPATTMTGRRLSLDARIAARLCRAYGIRHDLVTFDDAFPRDLPRCTELASRLSGGVSSLRQAPEVFLYSQVNAGYVARLSGNLGNQVGRGGTEGVSLRGADPGILAESLRPTGAADAHWLLSKLAGDEHTRLGVILQREIPFSSAANYSIGNHYAAQQSPYASRALIETLALRPAMRSSPSGSSLQMRLRDLRHRFLGEPASVSFQRTLVARIGGAVAEIPVNWGWRPSGGVSLPGVVMGAATLAGMVSRATGLDDGALRRPLEWSGLPALHDFHDSRRWLRIGLAELVHDTLRSARVTTSGLFEARVLAKVLDEHMSGARDHHATVTFALDLALADRAFCRSSGRHAPVPDDVTEVPLPRPNS